MAILGGFFKGYLELCSMYPDVIPMKGCVIFSILIFFLLTSCELLFEEPKSELAKLPHISQSGDWNFGCLVNGKANVVYNSMLMRAETRGNQFLFSFNKTEDNRVWSDEISAVRFELIEPLSIDVPYSLTLDSLFKAEYTEYENNNPICIYKPEQVYSGEITFSRIDRTQFIIAGTFNFTAENDSCQKLEVTEGRFDIHYFPY